MKNFQRNSNHAEVTFKTSLSNFLGKSDEINLELKLKTDTKTAMSENESSNNITPRQESSNLKTVQNIDTITTG